MCFGRLVLLCLLSFPLVSQTGADAAGISKKALGFLLAGRYSDLEDMFTPEMRSHLTEQVLREQISPQIRALGLAERPGEPVLEKAGAMTVAVIPVKFSATPVEWRFTVNADGKIAGLFFRPSESALAADWQRPSYSHPESFREREVTVGDTWRLPGTLSVPSASGAVPAIVLVHGSGPQDRDETIGANKPFRDLAEGLASKGIAVLRYEKRTKLYASRMAGLRDFTIQQETVEDALKAVALLRSQPEVSSARVFLVGHSLGGYIAPRIAQQDSRLAGLILMAANVRPLEELLQDQLQTMGLSGAQLEKAKADVLHALPLSYTNDLKAYSPAEEAGMLTLPMLVLQGERDYQVTLKDFNLWKSVLAPRGNVVFRSFPSLNHLFIAGQGKSLPSEYAQSGHVDGEVIDQIARWVLRSR